MNKYIIIIILILIIIFLVHAKKNKEKYTEGQININTLINLLTSNKISILDNKDIVIMQNNGVPITTDPSGNITINSKPISTDLCGNVIINKSRPIYVDNSGNIIVGDIIINNDNSLSNKSMDNINIYNYVTKIVLQKIHNDDTNQNIVDKSSINYLSCPNGNTLKCGAFSTYDCGVAVNVNTSNMKYSNYYNDLIKYPLAISGIKFQDINEEDINFDYYTTTVKNLTQSTSIEITSENLYTNLINSTKNFVGYSITTPVPVNGDIHSYTFTFIEPQLIKNIVIANRKDGFQNALNYATLLIYGKKLNQEVLLKSISLNNFDNNPYYTPGTFFTKSTITTTQEPLTVNLYP